MRKENFSIPLFLPDPIESAGHAHRPAEVLLGQECEDVCYNFVGQCVEVIGNFKYNFG